MQHLAILQIDQRAVAPGLATNRQSQLLSRVQGDFMRAHGEDGLRQDAAPLVQHRRLEATGGRATPTEAGTEESGLIRRGCRLATTQQCSANGEALRYPGEEMPSIHYIRSNCVTKQGRPSRLSRHRHQAH
jgi:hypothetical protein